MTKDSYALRAMNHPYFKNIVRSAVRRFGLYTGDIRQAALLQFVEMDRRGQAEPDDFGGLLRTVVHQAAFRLYEKEKRVRKYELVSMDEDSDEDRKTDFVGIDHTTPEKLCVIRERFERVLKGFENMPKGCRNVCETVWLGELLPEEAAKFLAISPDTVRNQIKKGREILRIGEIWR